MEPTHDKGVMAVITFHPIGMTSWGVGNHRKTIGKPAEQIAGAAEVPAKD